MPLGCRELDRWQEKITLYRWGDDGIAHVGDFATDNSTTVDT